MLAGHLQVTSRAILFIHACFKKIQNLKTVTFFLPKRGYRIRLRSFSLFLFVSRTSLFRLQFTDVMEKLRYIGLLRNTTNMTRLLEASLVL
nr:MAG TPA: hypothetical protein [Caudoviricetes sp.]